MTQRKDPYRKLYLSESNKKLSGVCGGIGEYFGVDPTLIRLAWVVVTLLSGILPGIIAYVVMAAVVPASGSDTGKDPEA